MNLLFGARSAGTRSPFSRLQSFGCAIWETRLNRRRIFSNCPWQNALKWPSNRLLRRSSNRMCEMGVRSISGAMARWLRYPPRSCGTRLSSRSKFLPNRLSTTSQPSRIHSTLPRFLGFWVEAPEKAGLPATPDYGRGERV
jgi:hypothetical protein